MTSVTDNNTNEQIEEYKKLIIAKDNEISKLNDINISKENEIKRLNKLIEDMKAGSLAEQLEQNFKKEKEKLLSKISDLELKIYNIKEEKNNIESKNKELNEKLESNSEENNNIDYSEKKNSENEADKIKMNYEELLKMKEDFEEQNKKLTEEIKSLKGKDKQENNYSNNNEELYNKIEELKNIIEDYKSGRIVPESSKISMDLIKNERLSDIEDIKRNFESKIKILNDNISNNVKNKKDLETIILKQEARINELNTLIKKRDKKIKSKEESINKNESYSLKLMNIINEQKLQIKNIKRQKNEEDMNQITELKRQINNLENTIELKESTISSMQKTHKILQDKYIKLCFNIKKQELENLLNHAKLMKKQKLERDALKNKSRYLSSLMNNNLPAFTEDSNGLSENEYPNLNTNSNITSAEKEKKENLNKGRNDIILPSITTNNSVKIEENINGSKEIIKDEGNRLDEVNEMMRKIIEEN